MWFCCVSLKVWRRFLYRENIYLNHFQQLQQHAQRVKKPCTAVNLTNLTSATLSSTFCFVFEPLSLQIKCRAATFIGLQRKKSSRAVVWFSPWHGGRAALCIWLWQTLLHKHSEAPALPFNLVTAEKPVVSTPACTQKQQTKATSGHRGAAKSKAAGCCWHQLLIWFVRGWAMWRSVGWEHKQRTEI